MAHQHGGRWGTVKVASKASTAYAIGDLVYNDGTNIIPAIATSGNLLGICKQVKSSGDAGTWGIAIAVPKDKSATFVLKVTGTFTKAYEGKYMDLSDAVTANTAATTYKPVRCVKYINDELGVFAINDPIA
jgi:hypothetical protein